MCSIGILFLRRILCKYTVQKKKRHRCTAQRIREIVLSRLSVYIRVCGDKNDQPCRTHAKKYLNSICLKIHTDHVTFSFEKRFSRKECKENSIVCITALVIIDKIVLVVH